MERNRTLSNRKLRKMRVRSRIVGSANRPRLTVNISSRHVTAQVIDDSSGQTLISTSTVGKNTTGKSMTEKAQWVGGEIAKKAKKAGITQLVFDRGDKQYHGRVAALAEAIRSEGVKI